MLDESERIAKAQALRTSCASHEGIAGAHLNWKTYGLALIVCSNSNTLHELDSAAFVAFLHSEIWHGATGVLGLT